MEVARRRGRRRKKLLDDPKEKREYRKLRGSIKSHSVENSLWRRLWTFREIDCVMNEYSSRLGHSCLAAEFTPFLVCPQGVYLISVPWGPCTWSLPWIKWSQLTSTRFDFWKSILILPDYLNLGLPSCFRPVKFRYNSLLSCSCYMSSLFIFLELHQPNK